MCPDRELISLLYDGELEQPVEQQLREHLCGCSRCAAQYRAYANLSEAMQDSGIDIVAMEAMESRITGRLEKGLLHPVRQYQFWQRRIGVPVPALAGMVLLALSGLTLYVFDRTTVDTLESDVWMVQLEEKRLEELMEVVGKRSETVEFEITLPELPLGSYQGEPQLIRSVDYRGGR